MISGSAYIIKPVGARKIIDWINDTNKVIQNDNLISKTCVVQTAYPYYTTVTQWCKSANHGLPSSVSSNVIELMKLWNNVR